MDSNLHDIDPLLGGTSPPPGSNASDSSSPGVSFQPMERNKASEVLKHKLAKRPDRQELIERHILEDTSVDASLHDKQRQLKKARLADDLNNRLSHRPGPLELIKGNILQTDETFAKAVKEGVIQFKSTSEGKALKYAPSIGQRFILEDETSSSGSDLGIGAGSPSQGYSSPGSSSGCSDQMSVCSSFPSLEATSEMAASPISTSSHSGSPTGSGYGIMVDSPQQTTQQSPGFGHHQQPPSYIPLNQHQSILFSTGGNPTSTHQPFLIHTTNGPATKGCNELGTAIMTPNGNLVLTSSILPSLLSQAAQNGQILAIPINLTGSALVLLTSTNTPGGGPPPVVPASSLPYIQRSHSIPPPSFISAPPGLGSTSFSSVNNIISSDGIKKSASTETIGSTPGLANRGTTGFSPNESKPTTRRKVKIEPLTEPVSLSDNQINALSGPPLCPATYTIPRPNPFASSLAPGLFSFASSTNSSSDIARQSNSSETFNTSLRPPGSGESAVSNSNNGKSTIRKKVQSKAQSKAAVPISLSECQLGLVSVPSMVSAAACLPIVQKSASIASTISSSSSGLGSSCNSNFSGIGSQPNSAESSSSVCSAGSSSGGGTTGSSPSENKSTTRKKVKQKAQPKPRTIKFHEYKVFNLFLYSQHQLTIILHFNPIY